MHHLSPSVAEAAGTLEISLYHDTMVPFRNLKQRELLNNFVLARLRYIIAENSRNALYLFLCVFNKEAPFTEGTALMLLHPALPVWVQL